MNTLAVTAVHHNSLSLIFVLVTIPQALVRSLVDSPEASAACPTPFDEGLLWRHDNLGHAEELRGQLQVC